MTTYPPVSYLKLFVTFRCNLKCAHCVHARISSTVEAEFDSRFLENLQRFIREAKRLSPSLRIYLSGGEPLLSERFFQTARIVQSAGLTYKTITNGMLLAQRYNDLLTAPPECVWITFNGIGDRHDTIVGGQGAYQHLRTSVLKSLPHLQDAHIKVGAVLMINPLTYNMLSQDLEELALFGFDEIVIQHLSFLSDAEIARHRTVYKQKFGAEPRFCFGEGADGSNIEPEPLFRELRKISERTYPCRTVIFPPLYKQNELDDYYGAAPQQWQNRRCSRALQEFWMLPDGGVTACFAHNIGHIGQSFSEILSSDAWRRWRRIFHELSEPLPGCMRCHRLYLGGY